MNFGVNTNASQDSRVIPQAGFEVVETEVVTLDQLTDGLRPDQGVYIKIDTQGWEENVFAGGARFLADHDRWFIKSEFAPMWLESQGSDPVSLLKRLVAEYDVYESSGRARWNCHDLAELIGSKLQPGCEADFVSYVRRLANRGLGWVDIYILPPEGRRGYSTATHHLVF